MKKLIQIFMISLLSTVISVSFAQEKPEMHHMNHNHKSHYASENHTNIKALTDEELNHLLNGEGMGLAKAGELNSYPGPKHVLDLSSELQLTTEQKERTEAIFNSMQTEAKKLGELVIEKEKELDSIFKENNPDEILVQNKIMEISNLMGKLRFVHLDAHIKQKEILT
jgi:Spy/CpxP family protein refolding chaperone